MKEEGETFDYSTSRCPYCKSKTIEGGIIKQAKTDEEKRILGYITKWQKMCLNRKKKWIVILE